MSLNPLRWLQVALTTALLFHAAAAMAVDSTFESNLPATAQTPIDKLVFARLKQLNIQPVLCSDAVFVRRAYLDVIGTLPTAKEARDFIQDPDTKNKRRLLIDRLLERPEFATYWAMRWSDVLRVKAEFPVNLWPNAAQAYHRWVMESIAANKPYDKFVREMLTSSGSNFRVGPVNFYRAVQNRTPDGIALAVALTFMGTRADTWPPEKLAGMAAFFAQIGYKPTNEWKEENVFWDPLGVSAVPGNVAPGRDAIVKPPAPATNAPVAPPILLPTNTPPQEAVFPDGKKIKLPPGKDPREVFADWLIPQKTSFFGGTTSNPHFTRPIVNRIWYWLLGRGIIHEPDDIRPDNPPSNPALIAHLEKELVASKYDLKHIYRLILNSQTYQLSSMPLKNPDAETSFARYPLRRLDAEVLIDAINKITGSTDLYTSPIPEPFTYIPDDMPAVGIADGSITSPFLTLFGRSARATGMENERNYKPLPAQWLHMLNSSHILRKISDGPKMRALLDSGRKPSELLEELYLTILSRLPTPDEIKTVEAYGNFTPPPPPPATTKTGAGKTAPKITVTPRPGQFVRRREQWVDITWSLLNSTEFLYRH